MLLQWTNSGYVLQVIPPQQISVGVQDVMQLTQAGLDMPVWNCLNSRLLLAEILKYFLVIMLILYFDCLFSAMLKTPISRFYFCFQCLYFVI